MNELAKVSFITLTTNRPPEDWGQVLRDTVTAGGIFEHFLHHAEVITLSRRSYRMHDRKGLKTKKPEVPST